MTNVVKSTPMSTTCYYGGGVERGGGSLMTNLGMNVRLKRRERCVLEMMKERYRDHRIVFCGKAV